MMLQRKMIVGWLDEARRPPHGECIEFTQEELDENLHCTDHKTGVQNTSGEAKSKVYSFYLLPCCSLHS